METNNGTAVAPLDMTVISSQLEQYRAVIAPEKQLSWLQLAHAKGTILDALKKKELELQGIMLSYNAQFKPEWNDDGFWLNITAEQKQEVVNALVELQGKLSEYLKGVKELPEIRKGFTRYLDRIFEELSAVEKRAVEWKGFEDAKQLYILIRDKKEKSDNVVLNKINEHDRFITFLKNEYIRIAADYRERLLNLLDQCYIFCLENEKITDQATLISEVKTVWEQMQMLKPDDLARFNYQLHSRDEMIAMMKEVVPPDYGQILLQSKDAVNTKFQMFWNDRQNAEKAKEFIQKEQNERNAEIESAATRQISVNNLTTAAATVSIGIDDANLKSSVTKRVMVVEDENPLWAQKVISSFLSNWPTASAYLRIRKWGNLSTSQMASALDDAGITVEGVSYESKTK